MRNQNGIYNVTLFYGSKGVDHETEPHEEDNLGTWKV